MTQGRVEGAGVFAASPSVVVQQQFNQLRSNSLVLCFRCLSWLDGGHLRSWASAQQQSRQSFSLIL